MVVDTPFRWFSYFPPTEIDLLLKLYFSLISFFEKVKLIKIKALNSNGTTMIKYIHLFTILFKPNNLKVRRLPEIRKININKNSKLEISVFRAYFPNRKKLIPIKNN